MCFFLYVCACVIGTKHQPIDGGTGPAHIQRPPVREKHGEPNESSGRKAEGGLRKSPQSQSKGLSGNLLSVTSGTVVKVFITVE